VLVRHLPADGILARARAGGALWSDVEHLLAGVFDSLQVLQWMYATAHRDPDRLPLPHPEPLPRPGEESAPEPAPASKYLPAASPEELRDWLNP
jgi:hypothetical protein